MDDINSALIRRAARGDDIAFSRILRTYKRQIICTIYPVLRSTQDIDDVYQDISFLLWRKIKTFKFQSQFSSWVYRLSFNCALGHLRKNSKAQKRLNYCVIDRPDYNTPEKYLIRKEISGVVSDTLSTYPFPYSYSFVSHNIDKVQQKVIAKNLHVSLTAIKSRNNRLKNHIKENLFYKFRECIGG